MITLNYPFPEAEAAQSLKTIADVCRRGGVITYPTETFYAIGGNALDEKLGQHLSKIKNRPPNKPFPTLVGSFESLKNLVSYWPENALKIAEKYWPGALTMVLPGLTNLPSAIMGEGHSIAVRWSSHPLISDLAKLSELPLISTSANLSNNPPTQKARDLDPEILGHTDLLIIADNSNVNSLPSTIIDARITPPTTLRRGAVEVDEARSCQPPG